MVTMNAVERAISPTKEMFQKVGTSAKNATNRLFTPDDATTGGDSVVKDVPTDVAASQQIVQDIEQAEKKFRELQGNLSEVLISLKEQHQVTLLLNKKRVQSAISFNVLVANTPLHTIAGADQLEELKSQMSNGANQTPNIEPTKFESQLQKVIEEDEKTQQSDESSASKQDSRRSAPKEKLNTKEDYRARAMFDSDDSEEEEEREPAERETRADKASGRDQYMQAEVQDDASAITGASFFQRVSSILSEVEEMEKKERKDKKSSKKDKKDKKKKDKKNKKEEDNAPFGEITVKKGFTENDSFGATALTCTRLTELYADNEYTFLIKYVEDWQRTVTERINSLLLAFLDHQEKLIHYRGKVEKLSGDIDKAYDSNHSLSRRKAQKWERNKLKLNGAREAHDSYGESLYLLLEEVTERAWKEFFPVLLRTMKFIVNHARDEAKVCGRMDKALDELEVLGMEHGIDANGRLDMIKTKKPEMFYTGERDFVPAVSKYDSFAK